MNKILWSIFKIWNFSPPVSNVFPLTKQNSPSINFPLSVQEGFKISHFENTTCSTFRTQRDTNLTFTNLKPLILKIRVVVRSFCFGPILSPLWHESPKTDTLKWNIGPYLTTFSPLANKTYEWRLYQRWRVMRSDGEGWVVEWSGSLCLRWRLQFSFNISMTWFEIHLKTH
jgi:hypothetical protein